MDEREMTKQDLGRVALYLADTWAGVHQHLMELRRSKDAKDGWLTPLMATNRRSVFPTALVWTPQAIYILGQLEGEPRILDKSRWGSSNAWLAFLEPCFDKAGVIYTADVVEMALELARRVTAMAQEETLRAKASDRYREAQGFLLGLATVSSLGE